MLHIHPKARTTPVVRAEIAGSEEPTGVLAQRFGVSTETIRQWCQRWSGSLRSPAPIVWEGHGRRARRGLRVAPDTNFALDDLTFVVWSRNPSAPLQAAAR